MTTLSLAPAVGILLALGATTALAFAKRNNKADAIRPWRHLLLTWGGCLAVILLMLFWEQRPLASIGIQPGNIRAWGIGALVGLSFVMLTGLSLRFGKPRALDGSAEMLLKLAATPLWFRIGAVLTAGITEEIVFRGYPIERLVEMTGNIWLAVLVPLVVFTLAHLSAWSLKHLISVFLAGLVLSGLYLWQHDLVACMIAHTITDMPIIFLPLLTRKLAATVANQRPASSPGHTA